MMPTSGTSRRGSTTSGPQPSGGADNALKDSGFRWSQTAGGARGSQPAGSGAFRELGVSPEAVSRVPTASRRRPPVAESIVRILNLPPEFFMTPDERGELHELPFFRSMSAATKQARTRAARRARWLEQITDYLGRIVSFPDWDFPDLSPPADPLMLTDDDIDHFAEDARKHWGMSEGPISNMVYLLENQGADRGPRLLRWLLHSTA